MKSLNYLRAVILGVGTYLFCVAEAKAQCLGTGDNTQPTLHGQSVPETTNTHPFANICPAASDVHVILRVTADLGCHADDATNCGTVPSCPGQDCICTDPDCHCNVAPQAKYITLRIGPPGGEVSITSGNTDPDPATQPYAVPARAWHDVPANGRFFEQWAGDDGSEKEFGISWCSGTPIFGES